MSVTVAFVGADELSFKLAASFLRSGARVRCFVPEADLSASAALEQLDGLLRCASPVEAARDAALVIVLCDADVVDDIFFGAEGIAKGLCAGSVVLIRSTLLPSQLENLGHKLADEKKDVFLLDGYIFSGLSDELKQQIVVVASGRQDVTEKLGSFSMV